MQPDRRGSVVDVALQGGRAEAGDAVSRARILDRLRLGDIIFRSITRAAAIAVLVILGGVITSTLLTLLVVPTFYDSIEIARDRMFAKFNRRAKRHNVALAFLMTFVEAILTLVFVRLIFRGIVRIGRFVSGRGRGTPQAA